MANLFVLGSLVYRRKARLDQRPIDLRSESWKPAELRIETRPALKE